MAHDALRIRLVAEATRRFCRYGVRQVRMDDIATALGCSKRTIYEIFPNKETLFAEVLKGMHEEERRCFYRFEGEAHSAINSLIEAFRIQMAASVSIHPNFFADIDYYPMTRDLLVQRRVERREAARDFFTRGVAEGDFLPSVDFNIFQRVCDGVVVMLKSTPDYKDLSFIDIFNNFLTVIIRGMCTLQGLARIDEFLATQQIPNHPNN